MVCRITAKLILKLRAEGLFGRATLTSVGVSRWRVSGVLEAAQQRCISWDEVHEKTENEVYSLLLPGREITNVFMPRRTGRPFTPSWPKSG